jgi:hypothetical protein
MNWPRQPPKVAVILVAVILMVVIPVAEVEVVIARGVVEAVVAKEGHPVAAGKPVQPRLPWPSGNGALVDFL